MDSAEASGRTVDDALRAALAQLGATLDDVEMTVLDEGKRPNFLGRGGRDATVRVDRLTPSAGSGPRPAEQRAGRGGDRPPSQDRPPRTDRERAPRGTERPRGGGGRSTRAGLENATPKLTEQDFHRAPGTPPAVPEGRPNTGRGDRPDRPDHQDRPDRPRRPSAPSSPRGERRRRDDEPPVDPDINAEEVDFAAQVVDDLLRLLDINAGLTIREPVTPGDGLGVVKAVIDVSGDDLGLLIGRRGDTLLSLQYIVNLIVSRRYPGPGGITIDVEHYRHRREDQVITLAQRMADRVRESGSPITLEPMPPAERRLIHLLLAEDPELMTNSVGEGENRKVVISTKD